MDLSLPRIVSLFSIHNNGTAISYIAASILDRMARRGVDVQLWVPTSDSGAHRPFIRNAIPSVLNAIAYNTCGEKRMLAVAERRFLSTLRPGDVAYIWPRPKWDLYDQAKRRGATVVRESINCAYAVAAQILQGEADAMGVPFEVDRATLEEEGRELEAADFHFAPSPLVAQSLRTVGVPDEKILRASYGWEPERIARASDHPRRTGADETRFLFVGLICLRKGVHRLIEAWKRAGTPGKLILAGRIDPDFPPRFLEAMNHPTIEVLPYTKNVGAVFQSADVFVFPSLEEGSPLVIYEALGAGLPIITSPMGSGGAAVEGEGAIILPPEDLDAWADAIRRLAASPELRAEMGRLSVARSAHVTWDACAETRMKLLGEALTRRRAN